MHGAHAWQQAKRAAEKEPKTKKKKMHSAKRECACMSIYAVRRDLRGGVLLQILNMLEFVLFCCF